MLKSYSSQLKAIQTALLPVTLFINVPSPSTNHQSDRRIQQAAWHWTKVSRTPYIPSFTQFQGISRGTR